MSTPHHTVHDPKGYYIMLGVPPQADLAAIKRAYRARAKLLHPDRNPSPRASQEFNALHEAYRVLSDPAARHAYDSGRECGGSNAPMAHRGGARGPAAAAEGSLTPRTCRVCGRTTRDLRHRVLMRVRGAGFRVRRAPIEGVFCRAHGERTAVASSLYCWALGWWALPWGPFLTLKALWFNLWGGRQPREENFHLLAFQARAFLARGNLPLARDLAEQARPLARAPAEKRHVHQLLEALADQPPPRRRGRWPLPGSAQVAQLAPLLLIAAVALYIAGPSKVIGGLISAAPQAVTAPSATSGSSSGTAMTRPPSAQGPFTGRTSPPPTPRTAPLDTSPPDETANRGPQSGTLSAVRVETVAVRSGPSPSFPVVAMVPGGTTLMITEAPREGAWIRVLSARGISGYVPLEALGTEAGDAAGRP